MRRPMNRVPPMTVIRIGPPDQVRNRAGKPVRAGRNGSGSGRGTIARMQDLTVADHVAAIHREGELMAAAVARGDLDATVPTCPDWTLRELTHHLGRTHHWAAAHVEQARSEPQSAAESEASGARCRPTPTSSTGTAPRTRRLVAALRAAPADLACWSFLPASSPLAFWARRQAHETAIHRADAQGGSGPIDPVPVDFAVDGIDELLMGFYDRPADGSGARTRAPSLSVPARRAGWSTLDLMAPARSAATGRRTVPYRARPVICTSRCGTGVG